MKLPISVTGTLIHRSLPENKRYRSVKSPGSVKGFTLFEVVVVVIIVTISASAILFSTSFVGGSSDLKLLGNELSKTIRLL